MVTRFQWLRFAAWNVGIRVCDRVGPIVDAAALRYERRFDRESPIYGCLLHPDRLIAFEVPDATWDRFGWRVPEVDE